MSDMRTPLEDAYEAWRAGGHVRCQAAALLSIAESLAYLMQISQAPQPPPASAPTPPTTTTPTCSSPQWG